MNSRSGTIVFFDLAGFSVESDPAQSELAQEFLDVIRDLISEVFQENLSRGAHDNSLILPTGDGAAVIIWNKGSAFETREDTAVYIAARILGWAKLHEPPVGVRCGINSGELDTVTDPYGQENVSGTAINIAQRVMDSAAPDQLLIHDLLARRLATERELVSGMSYVCPKDIHEILAKHNILIPVRSVTGQIQVDDTIVNFGLSKPPLEKWHLQIEPPILSVDKLGVPQKKAPPIVLFEKHDKAAFIGATNDQLPDVLRRAKDTKVKNPPWSEISVLFLSDDGLRQIRSDDRSHDQLVAAKRETIDQLHSLLPECASSWSLKEYSTPYYFASYWDWDRPEGRIHVSPYIWGVDVRTCPAFDFTWLTKKPTRSYDAYVAGLNTLLSKATDIDL